MRFLNYVVQNPNNVQFTFFHLNAISHLMATSIFLCATQTTLAHIISNIYWLHDIVSSSLYRYQMFTGGHVYSRTTTDDNNNQSVITLAETMTSANAVHVKLANHIITFIANVIIKLMLYIIKYINSLIYDVSYVTLQESNTHVNGVTCNYSFLAL